MNSIDLIPLYCSSIGFDRMASLLDSALAGDASSSGYLPYNIEVLEENRYAITLALAGFAEHELDIQVEKGVLTIKGHKADKESVNSFTKGSPIGPLNANLALRTMLKSRAPI